MFIWHLSMANGRWQMCFCEKVYEHFKMIYQLKLNHDVTPNSTPNCSRRQRLLLMYSQEKSACSFLQFEGQFGPTKIL